MNKIKLSYHRLYNSVVTKNKLTPSETISAYFEMHKYIVQHFDIPEKGLN